MAALVVQSRFAGLKIEDDDYPPNDNHKSKKTKPITKKVEPGKKMKNNVTKPIQAAPAQKKKKTKLYTASDDQWEMWKQKDEELVDGNYETELQEAIILSKLDFEEKKDVCKQVKKLHVQKKTAEPSHGGNKKSKKKNVMTLNQFNDMINADEAKCNNHVETPPEEEKPPEPDTEFFERVKDDTKNLIFKDKMDDTVKNRLNISDETITRVQFADALERKDKEIADLRDEINGLKKELLTVKFRNKKLCNILGQGEMKDKAEILVEVERLRAEQAELTTELAALHTDLEKERSKNADSRTNREKKHTTKKKNIRFDVSSEAILTKETSTGTG